MTIPTDEQNDLSRDLMDKVTEGITAASTDAVVKARRFNTKIISWKNGEIVEIDPYSIKIDEDKKH